MSVGPNARIAPDSAYVNGTGLPGGGAWYAALDLAQYQGIWGDAGGTWNPSAPIRIRGASLWFCGPVAFNNGSEAVRTFWGGGGITHDDSDYIELSPALTRTYTIGLSANGIDASYETFVSGGNPVVPRFQWLDTTDGMQTVAATNYSSGARMVVPLDMHQGATLASVTLSFQVASSHGPPAALPMLRVYKVDQLGNVTQLASNTALAGWVGGGFVTVSPTPGSGAVWYNGGFTQYLTWTADADVVIDNTTYRYFAEFVDEQGTSALGGNTFFALRPSFTAINDMRPQ